MKKCEIDDSSGKGRRSRVIILTMKLLAIFLFVGTMSVSASVYSQKTKIDLQLRNSTVGEILKSIEANSDFIFLYDNEFINTRIEKSVSLRGANIESILDELFGDSNIAYLIDDRQVFLYQKDDMKQLESLKSEVNAEQPQRKDLTGSVSDNDGRPLPGVSVVVKGTTIGTITDEYGQFKLSVPATTQKLLVSFVGMKSQELDITKKRSLTSQW
jgi:hypothetical protein